MVILQQYILVWQSVSDPTVLFEINSIIINEHDSKLPRLDTKKNRYVTKIRYKKTVSYQD